MGCYVFAHNHHDSPDGCRTALQNVEIIEQIKLYSVYKLLMNGENTFRIRISIHIARCTYILQCIYIFIISFYSIYYISGGVMFVIQLSTYNTHNICLKGSEVCVSSTYTYFYLDTQILFFIFFYGFFIFFRYSNKTKKKN